MDSPYYCKCQPNSETQLPEGFKIKMTRRLPVANKMYIGGISSEISKQALIEYLSKFGPITDFIINNDPDTDVPRDFGYVLFKDDSTVEKVLQVEKHVVCGKEIDLQRAKAMEPKYSYRKVFVGGLNPQVPKERILEYFGMFGKIESLRLPMCRTKNERRSFCFITYTDESSVRKLLENRFHYIGLEPCEVSITGPKRNPNPQELAESNAPSFGVAGYNRGANPQVAESNAAFCSVAKPYGDGEFLGNPNAFFVDGNGYAAVGGGQGLPVAPVPEPFVAYNPQFAFPPGAYDDFYNPYSNQPVFNSYSGQYFLGYDYYNYATGADCNEQANQAVAFHTDCHGLYQFF